MKRAALYLRQSLDVPEGIERQRRRCRALAEAREWSVVTEYVDNDVSASKDRGAGTAWSRMLDEAGRDFDVLIAVDLDRLLRRVEDLGPLTRSGIPVLTVDGEIDLTTADGEFRATMLAGIARFEVRRKSERQKRANEARARSGKRLSGARMFGFGTAMQVVDEEAEAVRDGYRMVLHGASLMDVAREWNGRGLSTTRTRQARSGHEGEPSPWERTSVRHVLLNPRYMGKATYLGEVVADGEWEALVDETTWRAVDDLLRDPTRASGARAAKHLLTGIAVCGVCGATVHAGGNARPGHRGYRCSASTGHFARLASPVEEFVERLVVGRLSMPDARTLLHRAPDVDVAALRDERRALEVRLEGVAIEFADGSLTGEQLRVVTRRMRERLAAIDSELADAGRVDLLGDVVTASDVGVAWEALPMSRRRAIVDELLTVTLHPPGRGTRTFRPESVGIEWRTA